MYKLAVQAPKGGHLHIHFNSVLGPEVLLNIARDPNVVKLMYISTDIQGPLTKDKLRGTKIKFHYMAKVEKAQLGNVFAKGYKGRTKDNEGKGEFERMLFSEFCDVFNKSNFDVKAMPWLQGKLVFSANEVRYEKGDAKTCSE